MNESFMKENVFYKELQKIKNIFFQTTRNEILFMNHTRNETSILNHIRDKKTHSLKSRNEHLIISVTQNVNNFT